MSTDDLEWPTWSVLAPLARNPDLTEGMRGTLHDPLWLLSRQWQFYEFRGADAGTPVDADVTLECDPFRTVHLRGDGDEGTPIPYDGGPLEPLIERERVVTADEPPTARLRAEAGGQFLRLLADAGYGDYGATDFPDSLRLSAPDEPMEAEDRRYFRVMAGRALDGTAVFRAIERAIGAFDAVVDSTATDPVDAWADADESELPLPVGATPSTAYREGVTAFVRWYLDLYDEPTAETGSAWRPTRLEYDASVTTGDGETAARFDVAEYPGGRLDWAAFSASSADTETDPGTSDDGAPDVTAGSTGGDSGGEGDGPDPTDAGDESIDVIPTQVDFPGMPSRRWWEFADSTIALDELSGDGVAIARLLVLEYAVEYGADWFRFPLDVPVGTFARISDLVVTDSFGVSARAEPVDDPDWRLFTTPADRTGHDEPGLLLPPTLSDSAAGDPLEHVVLGRDEMANLVFGLERLVEGPAGRPLDRTEFQVPRVVVEAVHAADDADDEYVTVANPGEDALDVSGYVVRTAASGDGDEGTSPDGADVTVFTFGERTLEANESVRLYTGEAPVDGALSAGFDSDEPVCRDADALDVIDDEGTLRCRRSLTSPDADGAYRLSTSVPPYWFPFTMDYDAADGAPSFDDPDATYRLTRALLLDADTLDAPLSELPKPLGTILDPDALTLPDDDGTLRLYEEEITRSGREIERRYQLARWHDGSVHLWSGRRSTNGAGELASGLRFDVLDDSE